MKRYTNKKIEMVRSLLLQGHTQSEVATKAGVNKASVKYYSKKLKKNGVAQTKAPKPTMRQVTPTLYTTQTNAEIKEALTNSSLADRIAAKVSENIKAYLTELLG